LTQAIFESFYKANFKRLVNHIRKSGIPYTDAEDLSQDLMLELFTNYDDDYLTDERMFWFFVNLRIRIAKREFHNRDVILQQGAVRQNEIDKDEFYEILADLMKNPEYEKVIRLFLDVGKKRTLRIVGNKEFKRLFKEMADKVQEVI
jgi:DNA-directed RNA polymerase specialized sigma24 family protein